ncbi:MAG: tripartite tricarboxylate transporter TctB family protein, partial [Candidatus Aureabacteria bacterium]|nr:tripartite tricarboxylate transporter TctB family protein [Candidatus Auribacterota bacterium]
MKKIVFLLFLASVLCSPGHSLCTDVLQDKDRARETVIFIPADEMKTVLDMEKEGIFVSYDEYRQLYEKARQHYEKGLSQIETPEEVKAPVIVQADYSGTIAGDLLKITSVYKIVKNGAGPEKLELSLRNVLCCDARLNGKKAQIYEMSGSPWVILPDKGHYELAVDFFVPVDLQDKQGFVSFHIPRALCGSIRLQTEPFYDVHFENVLFSSRKAGAGKTDFFGFIGSLETLNLEISNMRSSGEENVRVSSLETHSVFLRNDLVEQAAEYLLSVENGEIGSIDILLDKKTHIFEVAGKGISTWTREEKDGRDILHVTFHVPVSRKASLSLKTYSYPDAESAFFHVSDAQVKNLFSRKGALSVYYDESIRIDEEKIRYLRTSREGSPEKTPLQNYVHYRTYRIFNLPYEIMISRLDASRKTCIVQNNQVELGLPKIRFQSEISLSEIPQGLTHFVFRTPSSYHLRDVFAAVNDHPAKEYHEQKEEKLIINIRHPVSSRDTVTFFMTFEHYLDEGSLRNASQNVEIPILSYADPGKMCGTLHLTMDSELLLEDIVVKGYQPSEIMLYESRDQKQGIALDYEFRILDPKGSLRLSLRKAEQTAKTVTYLAVDEDLLKAHTYILYEIAAGSQDSFLFAIPHWDDSKINIEGSRIKEKKKISFDKFQEKVKLAPPVNLAGYDIWNVILQEKTAQSCLIEVSYQKKTGAEEALEDVPQVVPLGVVNDTGYIVLEAGRNIEIVTEKKALNEIEIHEIPKWPAYSSSNRIIESLRYFSRPFAFRLGISRKEESPVLASFALKETLAYTFGKDSDIFFECGYVIRNTNLQFLEIALPEGFVLWGATLQGKGIKPRKEKDQVLLIPLPVDSSEDISLRLTGHIERDKSAHMWESLEFQGPRLSIPCLESSLSLHYPENYVLLNIDGNFEKYPELYAQSPVLFSLFSNLFSSFGKNLRHLTGPALLFHAKSSKARAVAYREMQKQQRMLMEEDMMQTGDDEVMMEKSREHAAYPARGLLSFSEQEEADSEKQIQALKKYTKKKGILSLNITMPKEGLSVNTEKLWGNSCLQATFMSHNWRKSLSFFATFVFLFLGFYVQKRKIMSPLGFFLTTAVFFTLLPLSMLKSLTFLFNGAVLGAVIYATVLLMQFILKSAVQKGSFSLFLILSLMTIMTSSRNCTGAESRQSFPDVSVYIPYKNGVPTEIRGNEKIYVPT